MAAVLKRLFWLPLAIGLTLTCEISHADFTWTFQESGGNVVATGSGSIDTSDFTIIGTGSLSPYVSPETGALLTGSGGTYAYYKVIIIGSPFGTGSTMEAASSGSGSAVGFDLTNQLLALPVGYVSGDFISSNATWIGATLASLGFLPSIDTITLEDSPIKPVPGPPPPPKPKTELYQLTTPEPGGMILMGLGILCLSIWYGYRRVMPEIC